jgi:hypothetical protein
MLLKGQALRGVPYIPAFPDAWRDFYPDSQWYEGASNRVPDGQSAADTMKGT